MIHFGTPINSVGGREEGGPCLWNYVIPHFTGFLGKLELSREDVQDADGKAERVARSLFGRYYPNQTFTHDCYLKVGSYGRGTARKPCTDVDMLFILPDSDCGRISNLTGNKQSQLLREVKDALKLTFPATELRADGQVVLAPFSTYAVEIVPAFRLPDGKFLTANTNDGGSWQVSDPVAEYNHLHAADVLTNQKATHMTIMAKAWKRECNVQLPSTSLEVLSSMFVSAWENRDKDVYWYDWMVRDFFVFLYNYVNGWTRIIGTDRTIALGDCWKSKVETAYKRALKACEYEKADEDLNACWEWQKIFGNQFQRPMHYIGSLTGGAR